MTPWQSPMTRWPADRRARRAARQVDARALADAENSRKRADKDRRDAENYGGSRLARDLLPVHDALTRALDAAGERSSAPPPPP